MLIESIFLVNRASLVSRASPVKLDPKEPMACKETAETLDCPEKQESA